MTEVSAVGEPIDPAAIPGPDDALNFRRATIAQVQSIGNDPDATAERAARAIKLSRITGAKPELVKTDVDQFTKEAKDSVTKFLFENNKYLREYAREKPLGPELSQDDWGNLDKLSQKADEIYNSSVMKLFFKLGAFTEGAEYEDPALKTFREAGGPAGAATRALVAGALAIPEGLRQGAGTEFVSVEHKTIAAVTGEKDPMKVKLVEQLTPSEKAQVGLQVPLAATMGLIGAGMGGIMGAADAAGKEIYRSFFPDDPGGANVFGRHFAAMFEWKMNEMASMAPHLHPEAIAYKHWTSANTQHFHKTGEMLWYDPILAQQMRKVNERQVEMIHRLYDDIQKSATFEQDPAHARDYLKTIYNGTIAINGEAVAKLYGKKIPEPGDGLLGWVPNLVEQLEAAKKIGGDIHVPAADYYTNIKEEHFEALKDHVKVTPGEISKGEEDAAKEAAAKRKAVQPPELPKEGEATIDTGGEPATELPAIYIEEGTSGSTDISGMARPRIPKVEGKVEPPPLPKAEGTLTPPDYTAEKPPDWQQFPDFADNPDAVKAHVDEVSRAPQPAPFVDEPIPSMRGSAGLEPLFSVGDRKLAIKQRPFDPKIDQAYHITTDGKEIEPHVFGLHDETGAKVGFLDIIPLPKDNSLFVGNIGGLDKQGYTSNSFGPALTRDILRQIKEVYPEAKRIGGYRISGAREKAGTERLVWINLDDPWTIDTSTMFREILEGSTTKWYNLSPGTDVLIRTKQGLDDQHLTNIAMDEIRRTAGPNVHGLAVESIRTRIAQGTVGEIYPNAMYQHRADMWPLIAFALEERTGPGVLGSVRHEIGHHLRQYGLIREPEWETLTRTSRELGWIKKFRIEERYPGADMPLKLEESIVDGYKKWSEAKDKGIEHPDMRLHPKVLTIFEKLYEFFDRLRKRLADALGIKRELTFEDIFEKMRSGEVSQRPIDPIYPGMFMGEGRPRSFYDVPEEKPPLFKTPGAVGLTALQQRRFDARLRDQLEASTRKAQAEAEAIRKDMLDDWKHQRKTIAAEVESQLRARPVVASDLVLARGDYYGQRLAEKPKMSFDELTPEQRKGLPDNYYTKAGVESEYTADQLASMTGFPNGDMMIAALMEYNKAKTTAGMSANDYVKRLTQIETDRLMANELGSIDAAMTDRVNEHLASATHQDLLAQETLYLGMKAGLEAPLDKTSLRNALKDTFSESLASGIKPNYYRNQGAKFEAQVKTEMLGEDWEAAYKSQQAREDWHVLFGEAVKFEKERVAANKLFKKLAAREVKGIDIDFQDQIQDLMMKAGYRTRRHPDEIAISKQISGEGSLDAFSNNLKGDGYEPDISRDILDGNIKDANAMSVGEWRDFRNAIESLYHIGKAVNEINILGAKQAFADFRREVLANVTSLPMRTRESQTSGLPHILYGWDAILTRTEAIMKDLDLGKDMGPLVEMTIRPLAEAKHKEYSMEEKLSADIKALGMGKKWHKTLDKELPNDWFIDPQYAGGQTLFKIKRSDLVQIMLNWGNISNQRKFAESWGSSRVGKRASKIEAEAFTKKMTDYINEHATADDWKFVQGVWDIYKGYRGELNELWRRTSGTQPRMIQPRPIVTPHGTFEGGYYPLIRDRVMSGSPEATIAANQPFGPNYISATTPQGHLKDRTAASYYVDFHGSFTNIPQRMTQVIHDIAFREQVMQIRKVLQDKQIRNAIRNHYGPEYNDQLDPWLQRTANGATLDETALQVRDTFMRNMRMKLTNYALPFNWKVLGTPDLGKVTQIAGYWGPGRAEKLATANEYSKEIPHAIYNMDRDFREAMGRAVGEGKMGAYNAQAVRWGYSVVSYVSKEFRTATFTKYFNEALRDNKDVAATRERIYNAAVAAGETEVAAGTAAMDRASQHAAAIADTYVREHHGSAALHDLPAVMASGEAGRMLTMFYGYWSTMYNWQRTIPGSLRRGEYMKAAGDTWGSIIVGTIVGALIANDAKEEDTVADWFIKALPAQIMGTVPIVREIASYMFDGIASRSVFTTTIEAGGGAYNDIKKWSRGEPVEKGVRHAAAILGLFPGGPGFPGGLQAGRTGQGIYNYAMGREAPRDIFEWMRLLRTGEAELKHRGSQ